MEDTNMRDAADSAVGNKTVLEKTRIRDIRCTILDTFKKTFWGGRIIFGVGAF